MGIGKQTETHDIGQNPQGQQQFAGNLGDIKSNRDHHHRLAHLAQRHHATSSQTKDLVDQWGLELKRFDKAAGVDKIEFVDATQWQRDEEQGHQRLFLDVLPGLDEGIFFRTVGGGRMRQCKTKQPHDYPQQGT